MKRENYFIMNNRWKNGRKIAKYSIIIGFLSVGLGITGFLTTNFITVPVLYTACAITIGAIVTGVISFYKYNQLEDLRKQIKEKPDCEEESQEEPSVELLLEESFKKTQHSPFSFLRNLKTLKVIDIGAKKKSEPARVLVYKRKGDK
jgi:hypothetical protein